MAYQEEGPVYNAVPQIAGMLLPSASCAGARNLPLANGKLDLTSYQLSTLATGGHHFHTYTWIE